MLAATLEPCPDSTGGFAVRLGISYVRSVGDELAAAVAEGRPYHDLEELQRRTGAGLRALEALATAGAFGSLGLSRREALWGVGAVAQSGPDHLAGIVTGASSPVLPAMSEREAALADLWSTGVAADGHPTRFARAGLARLGVLTAADLRRGQPDGSRVRVAGVVTHRQRPATAQGITFVNLEDDRPHQRGRAQGLLGEAPPGGPGGAGHAGEGPLGARGR